MSKRGSVPSADDLAQRIDMPPVGVFRLLNDAEHDVLRQKIVIYADRRVKRLSRRSGLSSPTDYVRTAIADLAESKDDGSLTDATEIYHLLCRLINNAIRRDAFGHTVTIDKKRRTAKHVSIDDERSGEVENGTAVPAEFENELFARKFFAAKIDELFRLLASKGVPSKVLKRLRQATSNREEIEQIVAQFRKDKRTQKSGQFRIDPYEYAKSTGKSNRTAFRDLEQLEQARSELPSFDDFIADRDDSQN